MKVMIIEAKYKDKVILPEDIIKKLPKKITLAVTVQYKDSIETITNQLNKHGIETTLHKGIHTKYQGQVIGCDLVTNSQCHDAFLYVGDGVFHPKGLALKSKKEVHCYFPYTKEYAIISQKDIEHLLRREEAAKVQFLSTNKIGILVTIKYGQNNLKAAEEIKKYYKGKKEVTIFLTDTLEWNDLENYTFVEVWINTMCPRISYDDQNKVKKPILDINEAIKLIKLQDPAFAISSKLSAR